MIKTKKKKKKKKRLGGSKNIDICSTPTLEIKARDLTSFGDPDDDSPDDFCNLDQSVDGV